MKKIFKSILLAAAVLAGLQSLAQDEKPREKKRYEFTRERDINKSYPAAGNSLSIDNQFGQVNISTWDKNEIKVDIHIETSSTNKEWADHDFEKIDVKDKQQGSNISFETVFNSTEKKNISCRNCSNTMEITYEVHLPSSTKLSIENSFGGITIPDYNGPVSLINKYGTTNAGKMSKLEKIEIEFGTANLKYLNNADVTFKYSTITIDELSGSNTIRMEFCSYSRINLGADLQSLDLRDSYSKVHLRPSSGLGASYDIATSYGSFVDKTGVIRRTDTPTQFGGDLNKRFEGKTGSGAAKIKVTSTFGTVMVGEGSPDDIKEKKKSVRT